MKRILLALCLLFAAAASAAPVDVGGVRVEVPAPAGFVVVTPQMDAAWDVQTRFVSPGSVLFTGFVPQEWLQASSQGRNAQGLFRRTTVQTTKEMLRVTVAATEFTAFKGVLKVDNAKAFAEAQKDLPGVLDDISKGLSEKYAAKVALSASKMTPLPVHDEAERSIAYSLLVGYDVTTDAQTRSFVATATTTLLLVKGRVLVLYVYGDEHDLEWTRTVAKAWTAAVLDANRL